VRTSVSSTDQPGRTLKVVPHPGTFVKGVLLLLLAWLHQAEAQLTIPRGRPQLNAARTTFVADNGQLLRGPYTSTEWTAAAPLSEIARIKDLGCNAVHLYAEVFDPNYPNAGSTAPGYNMAEVDKIVQRTRDLGLYLVMTIGNGANNGNHNRQWSAAFWNLYAARYANETHVLYEIHNEPMAWGPSYLTGTTPAGALDLQIEAYNIIRTHAPNTPVLLFSYAVLAGTGGSNAALNDIRAFNQAVFGNQNAVWTNEAVGFHGYGGWEGTATAVANLINAGYPCFMTEFGWHRWGTSGGTALEVELTTDLERLGVSWLTFQYIPPSGVSAPVTNPQLFKDRVDAAGMSWTPDFGVWPLARGVYGNNGQPRATVANWVGNFLTGTLRIQAEDFDTGGEGVACHDTDAANTGGQYRITEPVDIATCNDIGGGFKVTSTADGEWMEYTILVREPGYYDVALRYATPASHCAVEFISNVRDTTGWRSLSSTGSFTTWATATTQVYLEFGRQKLRLNIPRGGFDVNWIELSPAATGIIPNGTYKLLNAGSALAMEALANDTVAASSYAGASVHQWNVQHRGGGQYSITSAATGRSWNMANDALQLVSAWNTSNERCYIPLPSGGGFHRFVQVGSGLSLNAATANPSPVRQQEFSGGGSQQWAILAPLSPAFPTGLTATALSSTEVALAWNAVPGASSYRIKRSADRGGPYTTVATGVTGTSSTDTVNAGARYYYVVSAISGSLEGPNSLEARVDPPPPWIAADIGSTGLAGTATSDGGVFSVGGSGADIWGTADAFRYVYVPVSGNFTITARVVGVGDTDVWAKAGVMIRESLNANSRNAFVAVTPGNGVTWQWRSSVGGTTGNANTSGLNAPYWVRIVRSGNTFSGYRSTDGATWVQQGNSQTLSMAATVYAGLAVTSHNNTRLCTATFDNVSVPGWLNPAPPPAPASLSATAANRRVALSWPASANASSYHVKRATIAGGPFTFLTNVATTSYTDADLENNVAYYYVVSAVNLAGESSHSPEAGAPGQLVAPAGLTVTPLSASQVNLAWNAFPGAAGYNVKRSLVSGGPYTLVATGVAGTAFADTTAGGVKFHYVVSAIVGGEETQDSEEASFTLPYPWLTQDVGSVGLAGDAVFDNGVFTLEGAGADIQGTADAFRFAYITATGNFTVEARVTSIENTDPWAKAGVMIRASLAAGAENAFVAMTPANGATWQSRSSTGGATAWTNTGGLTVPYWVRLVRSGNTVTGYRSADGATWTQMGSATLTGISTAYVGLAVSSHNVASLCTATFDNVTGPGWSSSVLMAQATVQSANWIGLTWNALAGASSYNVKRSTTSGGPYTTIATGVTGTSFTDTDANLLADPGYYYVLSAIVSGQETANGPEAAANIPPLAGAIIGTPGSYNNAGDTIARVFDGDLATFFDGPNSSNGNGCWVGRDFGAGVGNVIRLIRYCPRLGFPERMVGGVFQGANQADFSDAVTLATIVTAPPTGQFTSVNIASNATFRYVRYLSPNGGWGNIAELEFYGFLGSVPVPTGLAAAAANAQVSLTWNSTAGVTAYKISRATASDGPYTVVATTAATSFFDTGVINGITYYYVIAGLNSGVESATSPPVSARPSAPITAEEMQVVIALAAGNAELTIHSSVVGHTYQLQYRDDLILGTWQNHGPAVPGSGGSITLSMPMFGAQGFFRILIQR
jgi:endoglucanase